ncbi:TPA: recombinase RecA [Candidatus Gracilibacteria bacterium]|nr:recombinase RecA [Candidatus Peregrinibacteria bacterium]HIQ56891.1 recombinase RecA [Candidatus Gracilibacteria bacterium]HIQ57551.1 recombinase RecA [Candidatus Gracilibacteria bacterium]
MAKKSEENNKNLALDAAMSQIQKAYGEGAIMNLSDAKSMNVETISTGSIGLDIALGGGIPKGRIIEIYGPESSGKTTLALHIAAECQKQGGTVAFIDAEHALDPEYAKKIGLNLEKCSISQPDSGEQGLEITEILTRSGAVDLIIVDSVAALTPKAEIEGVMGDSHMGLQARLMSQALRKLTSVVSKTGTTILFINQLRMKIGVVFGNPEVTTGGNALKFYSSVRIEIRRGKKIEVGTGDDKVCTGNGVRVKVVKNKVAAPFKQAEFDIMYNEGISKTGDLINVAVKENIVKKAGAFYSYGETRLGQGIEKAKVFLKENTEMFDEIRNKVIEDTGINTGKSETTTTENKK